MEFLLQKIRNLPQYQDLVLQAGKATVLPGLGLPRAARLPVLAALHADLGRPVLLITDRSDHALSLFDELGLWTKAERHLFAEPNPLFYEQAAWGAATRRERLQTLAALAVHHLPFGLKPSTPPILISSARSLMTRTLPRRDFLKGCQRLAAGQGAQPDGLLRAWAAIGYQRVDTVLEPGQFSRRGGLVDIWPPADGLPVRLDFFGDEIETLRRFDPASQRTVEELESLLVTPAREYITSEEAKPGVELNEFHIPLLHPQPASLLDYLPPASLVMVDDLSLVAGMIEEVEEQAVGLRKESVEEGTLAADFPVPYITWTACRFMPRSSLGTRLRRRAKPAWDRPSPRGRGLQAGSSPSLNMPPAWRRATDRWSSSHGRPRACATCGTRAIPLQRVTPSSSRPPCPRAGSSKTCT